MSKAAGYVRVSTEKQKEEGSHHRQLTEIEDYAEKEGLDLDVYEDIAVSGQSDERKQYNKLLENKHEYDIIIVRELSRFGRSPEQVTQDILELEEEGIEFVSLKENIDTTTADGKLQLRIISAFNGYFADIRREQTERLIEKKREQGKSWGRPSKITGEALDKTLELKEEGWSYQKIADYLYLEYDVDVHRSTVRNTIKREQGDSE